MPIDRQQLLTKGGAWYGDVLPNADKLTPGEWDECLRLSTIAHKWPEQIGAIHTRESRKIPKLVDALYKKSTFPGWFEQEYIERGMDPEVARTEVIQDIQRLERRLAKSRLNVELCEAEMAIRKDMALPDTPDKYKGAGKPIKAGKYKFDLRGQNITRSPIGTTYYIDADSGSDAAAGTSTGAAWKTFAQYLTTSTRSAGDIAICRRSTTAGYHSSDVALDVDEDGDLANPITLEADYTNAFSTDVDVSGTATATATFGSATLTFTADVSGVIAAGDWLYVSGDDAIDHALYVLSVSTTTVTLALPYNGNNAGSGKTVINMGDNPFYGTTAYTTARFNIDNRFWNFYGIAFRSNVGSGISLFRLNGAYHNQLKNCISRSGASSRAAIEFNAGNAFVYNHIGIATGTLMTITGSVGANVYAKRISAPSTTTTHVLSSPTSPSLADFEECDFSASSGDVVNVGTTEYQGLFRFRNCRFHGSSNIFNVGATNIPRFVYHEDFNGTLGDSRQYIAHDSTDNDLTIQSETTTVRTGGSAVSIKVTPPTNLVSGSFMPAWLRIFEQVHYLPASATTLTVYLKPDDTAEWTADPTAAELWLEVEAWGHASNNYRKLTKSTGTIDMNGTSGWQALSVSVTPAQIDRSARVRLWYAKPKESGKTNIFYVDPLIVRSTSGSGDTLKQQGVWGEFQVVDAGAVSGGVATNLFGGGVVR